MTSDIDFSILKAEPISYYCADAEFLLDDIYNYHSSTYYDVTSLKFYLDKIKSSRILSDHDSTQATPKRCRHEGLRELVEAAAAPYLQHEFTK